MQRTERTVLALAVLLGLAVALTACAAPSSTTSGGADTITLQNYSFNPSTMTVKAGDTVTFKNADPVDHHIVVGTTDLGVQSSGTTKTWKAPGDGVYVMKCLIHPTMVGRITVGAGGSTIGTAPAGGGSMGTSPGAGGGTGGYGY